MGLSEKADNMYNVIRCILSWSVRDRSVSFCFVDERETHLRNISSAI